MTSTITCYIWKAYTSVGTVLYALYVIHLIFLMTIPVFLVKDNSQVVYPAQLQLLAREVPRGATILVQIYSQPLGTDKQSKVEYKT